MRQGVYDSDLFVLFLTNSVLSRKFCQKELAWAIEFQKPIVVIVEEEQRFWPFDYTRWSQNLCNKASNLRDKDTEFKWEEGIPKGTLGIAAPQLSYNQHLFSFVLRLILLSLSHAARWTDV